MFPNLRVLRDLRGEKAISITLTIAAIIAILTLGALAHAADKVRVSVTNYNMSYLAAGVAAKKGIFKEEGLDVEIIRMNANVSMSALIAGECDYTMIFA